MERLTKRDKYGHWYTNSVVYDRGLYSEDGEIFHKNPEIKVFDGEPINRLAEYEDAEEQGLLVSLPCKVGDTVYELTKGLSIYKPGLRHYVLEHTATELNIYDWARRGEFGKTIFLTPEEAEKALEEANRNG